MSNIYSCFCQVTDLIINGSTSAIGELTNKTITYAKEPNYYFRDNKPCELVVFRGISKTAKYEKIPDTHANPVIDMLNWLYEEAKKGNVSDSSQACLQLLKSTYVKGWVWKDVSRMVTNNDIWLPSSINFTYDVGGVVHEFKIWMANEFFAVEFPYREIYVIHPIAIEDIDFLAEKNYKEVQQRLQAETTDKVEDRVLKLTGYNEHPYTARIVMSFEIHDTVNIPYVNMGHWTIIYYGNPNDAEEETYEQIKNCILDNSKYKEDRWSEVIPDLFNPIEFVVIPHFNELGIVNETPLGSTYTPIFTFKGGDALAKKYGDFWDEKAIIESLQIVPHLYKSAKMSFVGKPKNNSGKIKILDNYPDYQLIPSSDSQAGMMSKDTAKFIFDLEEMIAGAEIVTPDGMTPKGIQRVIKKDRLYVTKRSGKVKLTMITRYQFVKDKLINE